MSIFKAGDPCLIFDGKGRRYLIELIENKDFHYHRGALPHNEIIGSEEGVALESSLGSRLVAIKPRLADYTLKMARGATVLYPKDTGAILVWADIAPGMTVLEAGTGSGGLAMALTRAVGSEGRVVSVERRQDHADIARKLINGFFGEIPAHLDLRVGDVEDAIEEVRPDRIVLDMPEPWHAVPAAAQHLAGGGIFCCYLPTIPQVQTVCEAIAKEPVFFDTLTFEVMHREWVVDGRSVRPSHRMVGHTGFLTVTRKRQVRPAPDAGEPQTTAPNDAAHEDVTPSA